MAALTSGIQKYGTNITASPVTLEGSPFAVGDTTIFVLNPSGSFISWQNGRSAFLNTLSAIPAYTAFQVRPGGGLTTDDTVFSFGTAISSGTTTVVNSNSLLF